jgi:hypothetical protein
MLAAAPLILAWLRELDAQVIIEPPHTVNRENGNERCKNIS